MICEEPVMAAPDYARLVDLPLDDALADELRRATVVPDEQMPADVVRIGSRVTYLDESAGERREIELVFPDDADPAAGRVSVLAPVGAALLGLAEGQAIEWPFPGGRVRRLRIERSLAPARG